MAKLAILLDKASVLSEGVTEKGIDCPGENPAPKSVKLTPTTVPLEL